MNQRTMIIVAGGSSTRFGSDKLLARVNQKAVLNHTIDAIAPFVDQIVLVVRSELIEQFRSPGLIVVAGGENRTYSETNGIAASPPSTLIGIHDGARPAVSRQLIDSLFEEAALTGGAIPGLEPDGLGIDNEVVHPTRGPIRVQTPQVFWGPELKAAYAAAARTGYTGPDTMAVVHEFTNLEVTVIPGDPANIKVTHPEDLDGLIIGNS
ncbi:MAG TPA: 2-C-methyl-D-erythritol 4-phosphate cytidylyltransferase [Acidimicrobiia bacterium]